ncbi:MAG: hypothetical protein LBV50_09085 [Novosphingobium sp.]|jgi:hypothetical protein|nr:hypothetical protein [Novosphingobium sp.]
MEGASVEKALDRMEAALTRIENAASRAAAPDRDLAARHERLRAAVAQSLGRLDMLLAEHRP